MTLAEALYFTFLDGEWRDFPISVDPPRVSNEGPDWYCRVRLGDETREVWGIDPVQALVLAIMYLQEGLRELEKQGTGLYLTRDLGQRIEIGPSFLGDFSVYQREG